MKDLKDYIYEQVGNTAFDNVNYIAVVLDEESHNKLTELIPDYIDNKFDPKEFCHHMTVAFHTNYTDEILEWSSKNLNKEFELTGYEIGVSDKAIAIKVNTKAESTNEIKHITLATNKKTNGKPVDSNYIKHWTTLEKTIKLKGKINYIYNK